MTKTELAWKGVQRPEHMHLSWEEAVVAAED